MFRFASAFTLIFYVLFSLNVTAEETNGVTAGSFRVSEQGAATYSIPISLPSGTSGVTPQISLGYSSQGGDGVMGIGWGLSFGSAISRCPKTIAQDGVISGIELSSNDQFCLDGQRLIKNSGTHGQDGAIYYTEIDSFAKVELHGNASDSGPLGFTVETKAGEVKYYGYVDSVVGEHAVTLLNIEEIVDIGIDAFIEPNGRATGSIAQAYLLKAIKDVSGNYILFEYNESDGSANINRVSYTGNVNNGQKPYAYAKMVYGTKTTPAIRSGYMSGSATKQDQILNSINVYLDGQVIHHYSLNYFVPTKAEENYTLESIQECTDADKYDCYPATTFDWHKPVLASSTTQEYCEEGDPGDEDECWDVTVSSDYNPFGNKRNTSLSGSSVYTNQSMDMNGDGYTDIIYTQSGYYKVAFGPTYFEKRTLTSIGDENAQYLLNLDYNGDGKRDLLVASSETANWYIVSFEENTTYENVCWTPPGGGGGIIQSRQSTPEYSIKRIIPGEICEQIATTSDLRVLNLGRKAKGLLGKAQIMDIDGDGLEDIVYQNGGAIDWYKNNGGSFAVGAQLVSFNSANSGLVLNSTIEKNTANMKNASGIDVNGDGRSDLIIHVTDSGSTCTVGSTTIYALNSWECVNEEGGVWSTFSNTGWRLYTSTGTSLIQAQSLGNYEDARVADLNGDGLTDLLLYSSGSVWSYRLSDGQGFLASQVLNVGSTTDTYKNQSYFIDLNGDGAVEFLKATSNTNWNIYVSQYDTDLSIAYSFRGKITKKSDAAYQFGDVDGDGKLDLLQGKNGTLWTVDYAPRSGKPKYAINIITNGFGIKTDIFYRPMTNASVYLFNTSDADLDTTTFSPMSGMSLVAHVSSDTNASGDSVGIRYQYGGFLVNRQGRGMLGFELVKTIDDQTGIETKSNYSQTFPFIGMPLATQQTLSDGRIISDASNVLADKTTTNGQYFPYIESSIELSSSVGSDDVLYQINKTVSDFTYDLYGNLTDSSVIVSDHNDSNSLITVTDNEFTGTNWDKRMGRLKSAEVTKTRGNIGISRTTDFTYYDKNHSTGRGMLHTSIVQTSLPLTTTYDYDQFGNKIKVTKTGDENAENTNSTNIQNRIAESFYGSNGRLIDYTLDSAGIQTDFLYNNGSANSPTGRITTLATTVNNITQTKTMDDWGRTIKSTSPGGSDTEIDYDLCSAVACDGSGAHYRVKTSKNGAPESRAYFDTFGRQIESRVKSFAGGWNIVRNTYDIQGRGDKSYEPSTGTSSFYTQPTYDLYGRVIQVKRPDGTNIYTDYYGLKTKFTDAKGNASYSWKNEQGELDQTEDAKGSELRYDYNAYGNLLQVNLYSGGVGAAYVQVINTFDDYGHKTQTNDKDKGIWNYQYNAFDELVEQTNAKNQISYLDYDDAGRLVRRYEPSGTSCWNYNSTNGRLDNEKIFNNANRSISQCSSYNNEHHRKTYFYDSNGRVDRTDVRIQSINANSNGTYTTSSTFDADGRVDEITYPNDLVIKNVYQNGYLDQIKNGSRVYQDITSMNAYGQVTNVNYANGAIENISYQSNNGRVTNHSINRNGANKHYLTYQYDNNGNISYRRHEFEDKGYTDWNETLTYDNLNRLDYRNVSITDNSYLTTAFKTDQNYNYDNWGNLTYKYGVGNYSYDSTKKNRLASTTNAPAGSSNYSMSYDDNGNITSDGTGRSFTYHSFDKVDRITKGTTYSEFEYAANRARYYKRDRRTESGVYAHYYNTYIGAYEKIHRTGGGKSTLTEHKVTIGNIVITDRSDGTDAENYLHKDHLGSTISVTDKVGSVVQQFTYDPWGKQTKIYQTPSFLNMTFNQPTNRGYTGHEHIDGLDIIHMNGRIYDANIGRFMQADPNIQSPGNFQNYNRYSYVLNNPLSMTDPSGFFFKKIFRAVKKHWRTIASIAVSFYMGPWASTYFNSAILGGAVTGFVAGGIATGSLRGAQVGALSGGLFGAVSVLADSMQLSNIQNIVSTKNLKLLSKLKNYGGNFLTSGQISTIIATHAAIGGIIAVKQGGKFGHGFFSAGFTKATMSSFVSSKINIGNAIKSAVISGTASVVSGGKFANGAVTGAFQYSLNWATKAHNMFLQKAYGESVSALEQAFIEGGSRTVDDDQSAENSFKHAMTSEKCDNQCVSTEMGSFIEENMAIFQSNKNGNEYQRLKALFSLGMAAHPIMDQTSPVHTDSSGKPIEWQLYKAFVHGPFPTSREGYRTAIQPKYSVPTVNRLKALWDGG
ncbi:MAG: hypothetical protein COA86_16255 [Kangiella sp.]|nr:MAG: hypothetical protein COA86_16255 [Kangiella sp.]